MASEIESEMANLTPGTENYRKAQTEYWNAINQMYQCNLQILQLQIEMDQLEVEHLEAIKEEYEARNAIQQAYQSIDDFNISRLQSRGE